jgi:hypothetical protein
MRAFTLFTGNREPSIDEMLDDPIVGLVMKRDSVTPDEVRDLMDCVGRRRRGKRTGSPLSASLCAAEEL